MFVLIARYTKPLEEVDQHFEGHVAWIGRHAAAGRILVTGRQVPPVGGILIASAGSRDELDAMVAEDPFVIAGASEYEILEYEVKRAAPGLERLLEA
jgi:uncharacterized protein YciI